MNKYCFEFKKNLLEVPDDIVKIFLEYQWPGNVREFENVIRRAIVLRDWNFIFKELDLNRVAAAGAPDAGSEDGPSSFQWNDDMVKDFFEAKDFSLKKISKAYVSEAERHAILKALRETQWNRKKAARVLRVSYKTLLNRIEEFGLQP